jgi:hypothetical protein
LFARAYDAFFQPYHHLVWPSFHEATTKGWSFKSIAVLLVNWNIQLGSKTDLFFGPKNLTKFQDSTTSQYCILIVYVLLLAILCYQNTVTAKTVKLICSLESLQSPLGVEARHQDFGWSLFCVLSLRSVFPTGCNLFTPFCQKQYVNFGTLTSNTYCLFDILSSEWWCILHDIFCKRGVLFWNASFKQVTSDIFAVFSCTA